MSDLDALKQEREDWDALLKSPGWARLMSYVKDQWGAAACDLRMEKALDADNLNDVKVIARVRKELTAVIRRPEERMQELAHLMAPLPQTMSRRGAL